MIRCGWIDTINKPALSQLQTSSSDSCTEKQGEEPSTASNFPFKIPLITAVLSHVPVPEMGATEH
jgi:hypothetical protein